jgi:hypothetical protein
VREGSAFLIVREEENVLDKSFPSGKQERVTKKRGKIRRRQAYADLG